MRAAIQLVSQASVLVDEQIVGKIGNGLVVLLGVNKSDSESDVKYLANKISGLRIFPDDGQLMNKSIKETGGEMLVISQFTLYGDCRKGRRPSFSKAAGPEQASKLYEIFMDKVREQGVHVESGQFQAMMQVNLTNEGPVTILLDSEKSI